jgi:hypothetical protein
MCWVVLDTIGTYRHKAYEIFLIFRGFENKKLKTLNVNKRQNMAVKLEGANLLIGRKDGALWNEMIWKGFLQAVRHERGYLVHIHGFH